MDNRPLGIIDSGLGGLAIAQAIWQTLPHESTIYLADHQFFPYGSQSTQTINRRLVKLFNWLIAHNCKLVVIACNTITVSSIKFLRSLFSLPIIGTVPAIKPAIQANLKDNIVVLATPKTARSTYFKLMIKQLDQQGRVEALACQGLAQAIEKYYLNKLKLKQILSQYLNQIKIPYQSLVLGSTHYILVKDLIRQLVKPGVKIIETSQAIAQQTQNRIFAHNLQASLQNKAQLLFFTTARPKQASHLSSALLKQSIMFKSCSL